MGDLDGDGCSIAGAGPPKGSMRSALDCVCWNSTTNTSQPSHRTGGVDRIAALRLTYLTFLPNRFSGPEAPSMRPATDPPAINSPEPRVSVSMHSSRHARRWHWLSIPACAWRPWAAPQNFKTRGLNRPWWASGTGLKVAQSALI